eukprot:TRINITY_DN10650_c0_g1_i1.p1 TRINITY_DN10650_c0_g1~~TRINITY_DN10650_c0_g1_i1.p1  ORF type:complete len:779 (+),score=126.84 TRINITY_DN10650_c0_g1_i1:84-2339(+)
MFCSHCHTSMCCPKLCTTLLMPTITPLLETEHGRRALIYYRQGMCRDRDRLQRVEMLSQAISYVSNFREAFFWRAVLDVRDVRGNLKDMHVALSLSEPNTTQYYVILAQINAMQRNVDKTITLLDKAEELASNEGDLGEVHYFRSYAYWWVDKDEEAMQDCVKSIEYCYNLKSSHAHLGDIYHYNGKSDEQIEYHFQKSLEPVPNYLELVNYAKYLKKKHRYHEAITILNQAIERNPYSYLAYEELAPISPDQMSTCRSGISVDKHGQAVRCRLLYAVLLGEKKQFQNALSVLSEGIKKHPNVEWYCLRGQLSQGFAALDPGNFPLGKELGIIDLRKALSMDPSDPEVQFWMFRSLPDDDPEKKQRLRNVLFLSSKYPRLSLSKNEIDEILNDPELKEFKLFDKEYLGLLRILQKGTVYQYQGRTRKCISLLANFCERDDVRFYLFNFYYDQIYSWTFHSNPTISASAKVILQKIIRPVNYSPSPLQFDENNSWTDIKLRCQGRIVECNRVVIDEWDYSEYPIDGEYIEIPFKFEILEALLGYLYRKKIILKTKYLEEFFELSEKLNLPKLTQFLEQEVELMRFSSVQNYIEYPQEKSYKFTLIPKDFERHLNNQEISDVVFEFPDTCERYYAHKSIIASSSDYLKNMLRSGMKESTTSVIKVSTVSSDVFYEVLKYLYGVHINFSLENCVEILATADNFQLEDLRLLTTLYIISNIDDSNVEDVLEISEQYNAPRLRRHCDVHQHNQHKL